MPALGEYDVHIAFHGASGSRTRRAMSHGHAVEALGFGVVGPAKHVRRKSERAEMWFGDDWYEDLMKSRRGRVYYHPSASRVARELYPIYPPSAFTYSARQPDSKQCKLAKDPMERRIDVLTWD